MDISEARPCAHNGEVVGLACDATNSIMISAGYQGDIKVYFMRFYIMLYFNLAEVVMLEVEEDLN